MPNWLLPEGMEDDEAKPEARPNDAIVFRRGRSWSELLTATPAQRKWIHDYVGHERVAFYGKERVSDWFTMLTVNGLLPSGLLDMVRRAAPDAGFTLNVLDDRGQPPCQDDKQATTSWLRPDQLVALDRCLRHPHGLLEAPTGAGKTEVFIAMTLRLGCQWLFVVHRSDLVRQTADRYRLRTGEKAGTFERGVWARGTGNVTVATFQSIDRARRDKKPDFQKLVDGIEALFVDEVHAQPAESFYRGTLRMKRAYFRYGASATALEKGPEQTLRTVGALGPILHKIGVRELVDLGLLAMPRARLVKCRHNGRGVDDMQSWRAVYSGCIVRCAHRNELVADIAEAAAKPCILFVDEVQQGKILLPMLLERGLLAEMADGKTWKDARTSVLEALGRGELDVLVCTVIFQEGIDVPELRAVVNAAGKQSSVAALQRPGRGMRKLEGKDEFELWDIYDRDQKWLRNHSRERVAAYNSRDYDVEVFDDLAAAVAHRDGKVQMVIK